jgi:hypothetical protein
MSIGFLLLCAYLVGVGINGNGLGFVDEIKKDVPDFAPFVVAVIVLLMLSKSKARPVVGPFIALAVLTTVLTKFAETQREVKRSYELVTKKDR